MDIEHIKKQWPLEPILSIGRFENGVINETYHVKTERNQYVLRLYNYRKHGDVEFEIALLHHLEGLPVPHLVEVRGSYLMQYDGVPAVIYKYLDGNHLKHFTAEQHEDIGRFLATFHAKGSNFVWNKKRDGLYVFSPDRIEDMMHTVTSSDIPFQERLSALVQCVRACNPAVSLPSGPIHVDVKPENVLFYEGRLSGVIDFDNFYRGAFVVDLAKTMLWFGLDGPRLHIQKMKAVYRGYVKERTLRTDEFDALYNAMRFAFASHLFVDLYNYAKGIIPKSYFDFLMSDFYGAYSSLPSREEFYRYMSVQPSYATLTIKELRAKVQKTAPEGERETYSGKTIRFFSIFVTRFLARTPITPNQITVVSVLIFLAGVSYFVIPGYAAPVVGAVLVYISIIFDACDGEIARLKGNKSGVGDIYTEPVSHDIQYALMFIPLSLGAYMRTGSVIIIYVGFAAAVAKLMTRFLIMRFDVMQSILRERRGEMAPQRSVSPVPKNIFKQVYHFFNRNIFSSVGLVFPLLLFAVIDHVDLFLWLYAAGFFLFFVSHFVRQVLHVSRLSK